MTELLLLLSFRQLLHVAKQSRLLNNLDEHFRRGQALCNDAKLREKANQLVCTTFAVGGIFVRFVDNSGAQVGNVLLQFVGGQINWTQLNINAAVPFGATKVQYYNFVYAPLGSRVGDKVYFDDSVLSVGVPIALPCLIGGNPC